MGLVRVDSWKLVCDDCKVEYEDGNGWTIWGESGSYAEDSARDDDWLVRPDLALCLRCSMKKPYCRDEDNRCLTRESLVEADDGWLYCPEHIEQGMDTPRANEETP